MGQGRYIIAAGLASVAMLALLLPFEAQGQIKALSPETDGYPGPGTLTDRLQRSVGDPGKFDEGFYEQVRGMQGQAGWQRSADSGYHNVIVVVTKYDENGRDVSAGNKDAVAEMLRQAGARSIEASETLSFVIASVPVGRILELSWHGEVYRLGDGEAPSTPAIETMRSTIGATVDDLRRADGTVTNGSGVTVGVLDFGVNHPQGINDKVVGRVACDPFNCRSVTAESVIGRDTANQMASHGTLVALVMAGSGFSQNNGIAPGVGILDAGVGSHSFPYTDNAAISQGIDWLLRNHADASNLSMGDVNCNRVSFGTTRQLISGEAVENGMVLAVSAGNDGSSGSGQNRTPVYNSINEWGCSHNVITVGGIDDRNPDDIRMYTASGRGPGSHLVNGTVHPILKPEIVAPANSIGMPMYTANGKIGHASGTSFSAPAVTAAAALVLQERHLEPAGVRAALLLGANWTGPVPCTSVQYEQANASDNCSYKRQPTDFAEANHDGSLEIVNNVGFGILNAGMAVDYAVRASGSHLVEGSLDSDAEIDGYVFEIADAGEPVKVILSWTSDPHYEGIFAFRGENYFADLGFTVDCPGMETVSAQSAYQANEFAVFTPAEAGTCTVVVTGSGVDTPRRSQQNYALASTLPLGAVDIVRPAPTISTGEQSPTNAYSITFSVDFGEPVDAGTFAASDISASGGTVSGPLPANGTARFFTFEVSNLAAGNLTVSIPEGAILDPAGNSNTASEPHVIEIERTRPAPLISTAESSPVNAYSITFSVDFGEPVDRATFAASDISASAGTVSVPLPANGTARFFTFEISNLAAGNLTVSIPEGGILDPAGNSNTASEPHVIEIERPRPAPLISTAESSPVNAYSITFSVDFGEPVDAGTFAASDISASGGTVSGPLPANGTARFFTFEVSNLAAGNLTVSIPEGAILDPAGNSNTASEPHVIEIERTRPAPLISTAESSPVNAYSITFSVDFGEPVDRATFAASDISASAGTVSVPLPANGTARFFTFEISNLAAGNLTVSIPEGGILDPAGNGNVASNSLTVTMTGIPAGAEPGDAFVTTWQTTSANEEIVITTGGTDGAYTVTWGDAGIYTNVSGDQTHTYKEPGTYTVSIYGDFTRIYLPYHPANALKLQSIEQWGDIRWESMNGAFSGASNMAYRAADAPDLSAVTDMSEMFRFALLFNGNLSDWDVSSVTDMSGMFAITDTFNGGISAWNVASVTDMSDMFMAAHAFDQNLGNWYVVLHDASISGTGQTLPISAQNGYLDGQNPTYGVDDPRFVVTDGALAIKPGQSVPPGSYEVTVTSAGGFGKGNSKAVEITVDVAQTNSPPTVDAGADQAVDEGTPVTLSGTATDPDGNPLTYSWTHDSALDIGLTGADTASVSFTAPQVAASAIITFTLTADDGTHTSSDAVAITVLDATAGSNDLEEDEATAVLEPAAPPGPRDIGRITLNSAQPGTIQAAWDAPSEAPVDYRISWAKAGESYRTWSDPAGNAYPTGPSQAITDLEEDEQYNVKVRARYGGTSGDWSGEITITVLDATANSPPTVDAGADQAVDEGTPVTLSGTATDPDGNPLTYSWTHDSALDIGLTGADTASVSFTAPQVAASAIITFTLTADDGTHTSSDAVAITILDATANSPPTVDAGADQAVDEGTPVTLSGTATDPDGNPLTYSWTHDSALDIGLTGADTTSVSFTAPQVAASTTVTFTLTADDGTHTSSDAVAITILDATANSSPTPNQAPEIVDMGGFEDVPGFSSIYEAEPGDTVRINPTVRDADGDELTFTWELLAVYGHQISDDAKQAINDAVRDDGEDVSFTAPAVPQDRESRLLMLFTVSDGNSDTIGVAYVYVSG